MKAYKGFSVFRYPLYGVGTEVYWLNVLCDARPRNGPRHPVDVGFGPTGAERRPHLCCGLLDERVEFIETSSALTALWMVSGSSKPVKDK